MKIFFKSRDRELSEYINDFNDRSISLSRNGLILGVILYASFGIWDYYLLPESRVCAWIIRYAIVVPFVSVMLLLTYSPRFKQYVKLILIYCVAFGGVGILGMIATSNSSEPGFHFYYIGLIIVILWTHSMLRVSSKTANIISLLIISGYALTATIVHNLHAETFSVFSSNLFFLLAAALVGAITSRSYENFIIEDYKKQSIISKESENANEIRKKLEESDRVKNRLLSIISHDLRSPIASTKGILNLYQMGMITNEEFKEQISKLINSLDSTGVLLDNLLTWSILDMKKTTLKSSFNLKNTVDEIIRLVLPMAEQKQIEIENDIDPELHLYADASMISLVIRNLIFNAVKYTEHGSISVFANCNESIAEIFIRDSGVGISDAVAQNLFKWDGNQPVEGTKKEKGSGLGLLICKEFVEKHGGLLSFIRNNGRGTTFYFTIPNQIESSKTDQPEMELVLS